MRRMQQKGLHTTPEAAQLLAERVEGNMLAAAQEVDKLLLLYGPGQLSLEQLEEGVANSARYNVFELVDTALLGDVPRSVRVLQGLYGEGVEPVLILWALLRELRSLALMAEQLAQGQPLGQIFTAHRIWDNRKAAVGAALQRHRPATWQALVRLGGRIDRIVKGAEQGNAKDELQQLTLLIAGVRLV
jgi:DNA polymerase-3 subunit delta